MCLKDQIPTGKRRIGESCLSGSSVRGGEQGEEQGSKWEVGSGSGVGCVGRGTVETRGAGWR